MKNFVLSILVSLCCVSIFSVISAKDVKDPNPPPPHPIKVPPRPKKKATPIVVAQAPPKPEVEVFKEPPRPIEVVEAPPPEAEPRVKYDPVSIELDAQTAYVIGERAIFRLLNAGDIASITWTILPAGTTGLKVYDNKLTADFVSRVPGTYVILVAASGKDGSVAQAFHSFDLQTFMPSPEIELEPEQPSTPTTKRESSLEKSKQIVRDFTNAVKSPNKIQEMRELRTALTLVAGRIDSGDVVFPDGRDKISYAISKMRSQAKAGMGGDLGSWDKWFEDLEAFYKELERVGGIKGPRNISAATRNVVKVLSGQ